MLTRYLHETATGFPMESKRYSERTILRETFVSGQLLYVASQSHVSTRNSDVSQGTAKRYDTPTMPMRN